MTPDIVITPTYNTFNLAVTDNSTYDVPLVDPTIDISVPGFSTVTLDFTVDSTNIFDSTDLELTTAGNEVALPDGVYYFVYPSSESTYVEKNIMRVDAIMEKFDEAFMQLDMMECDKAIRTQTKVTLNTIYLLIQASIAAANNCAVTKSETLYTQADTMLDNLLANDCGCFGNNYIINF